MLPTAVSYIIACCLLLKWLGHSRPARNRCMPHVAERESRLSPASHKDELHQRRRQPLPHARPCALAIAWALWHSHPPVVSRKEIHISRPPAPALATHALYSPPGNAGPLTGLSPPFHPSAHEGWSLGPLSLSPFFVSPLHPLFFFLTSLSFFLSFIPFSFPSHIHPSLLILSPC